MTVQIERWGETIEVGVELGYYGSGTRAMKLVTETGEVYAIPSVNLMEGYGLIPKPGCLFIKDYAESEGMVEALVNANVVILTGRRVTFGPYDTSATEVRLVDDPDERTVEEERMSMDSGETGVLTPVEKRVAAWLVKHPWRLDEQPAGRSAEGANCVAREWEHEANIILSGKCPGCGAKGKAEPALAGMDDEDAVKAVERMFSGE